MKDLEGKRWLTMNNAGNDLWPKLLVQYSKTGHKRPLPMVEGKFISKSTTAVGKSSSSGSSGTSAGTSKSTSAAPTRVKVTSYIADGQLCYAWGNTVDERSYAIEWVIVKDSGGTTQLLHRSKSLVSVHP